jgi:hypothetical protein
VPELGYRRLPFTPPQRPKDTPASRRTPHADSRTLDLLLHCQNCAADNGAVTNVGVERKHKGLCILAINLPAVG